MYKNDRKVKSTFKLRMIHIDSIDYLETLIYMTNSRVLESVFRSDL